MYSSQRLGKSNVLLLVKTGKSILLHFEFLFRFLETYSVNFCGFHNTVLIILCSFTVIFRRCGVLLLFVEFGSLRGNTACCVRRKVRFSLHSPFIYVHFMYYMTVTIYLQNFSCKLKNVANDVNASIVLF